MCCLFRLSKQQLNGRGYSGKKLYFFQTWSNEWDRVDQGIFVIEKVNVQIDVGRAYGDNWGRESHYFGSMAVCDEIGARRQRIDEEDGGDEWWACEDEGFLVFELLGF